MKYNVVRMRYNLPEAYLEAIGRVTAYWSSLEVAVDYAISQLLKVPSGAHAAVTVGMGFPYRLDMLSGLGETLLKKGAIRTELINLIAAIRITQDDRNFVVHAHWIKSGNGLQGYLGKRNKTGARLEIWDLEDFASLADEISRLDGRLSGWWLSRPRRTQRLSWHKRFLEPPRGSHGEALHAQKPARHERQPPPSRA